MLGMTAMDIVILVLWAGALLSLIWLMAALWLVAAWRVRHWATPGTDEGEIGPAGEQSLEQLRRMAAALDSCPSRRPGPRAVI
jgi:hypothetical protein